VTPQPGNLIRWGARSNPSVSYAMLCGFTDGGCALNVIISAGRNPCTEVASYPRGAILVQQDCDEIIA
jgi:hypothetical protein